MSDHNASLFSLGMIYRYGFGVRKNLKLAYDFFMKSYKTHVGIRNLPVVHATG